MSRDPPFPSSRWKDWASASPCAADSSAARSPRSTPSTACRSRWSRARRWASSASSGCGKSTLARMIVRLIAPSEGAIRLRGVELSALSARAMRKYRRDIQFVFQDPFASLNPRLRAGQIVGEAIENFGPERGRAIADRVAALFARVGLRPAQMQNFPHEFSGGQRQRLGIARALSVNRGSVRHFVEFSYCSRTRGAARFRARERRAHRPCAGGFRDDARHSRRRDRDDLPGADDVAQSGVHDRRADRGSDPAAPGQGSRGGEARGAAHARAGAHSGGGRRCSTAIRTSFRAACASA